MPQRIHDCIHNRGGGTNRGGFAHAFRADGVMRGRGDGFAEFPFGGFDGGGEQVIHERRAMNLAVFVVGDFFEHGGGKAHRQAAVNLAFDDHGVDADAAVIHRDKTADFHLAGAPVNVHDADVRAERVGQVGRVIIVDRFQARFHPLRVVGVRGESDLLDGLALIG